ncbi:hypothetical protein P9112_000392 [Eukaryota sp. TZLM1-RC]
MYSSAGFLGAPVSKTYLIIVTICSFLWFALHAPTITTSLLLQSDNFMRAIYAFYTFFSFPIAGILLVGAPLIYIGRISERLLGSSRFAGMLILSNIVSFAAQLLLSRYDFPSTSTLFPSPDTPFFTPACVFSSTLLSLMAYPASATTKIFSVVPINEKFFVFILLAQLILVFPPFTIVAFLIGLVIATLTNYCSFFRTILDLIVPSFFSKFCAQFILPILATRPPPTVSVSSSMATAFPQGVPFQRHVEDLPPYQPPDTMVELLTDMGFREGEARRALVTSRGNIEGAIEVLTEG